MKNIATFGLYRTRQNVEKSVEVLKRNGFRSADISVLLPDNPGTKDIGHEKHTKAPEGATVGGTSGAVVGGALGWLVGIGALTIPVLSSFALAGPIVAALAGAGALGTFGGLTGAFLGAGMPEYEAKRYEGRITRGGILLSVHCDNEEWRDRARNILNASGAEDVASTSEASADFAQSDRPMPRPHSVV